MRRELAARNNLNDKMPSENKTQKPIEIFTDGACSGNPGPGGWGAIVRINHEERELSGAARHTTNNIMELTAVIQALKSLGEPSEVCVTTDSKYVKDGITSWIHKWKRNSWKTADKKSVKNKELWRMLDALANAHTVEWRWVKGHSGHAENERCDELAREAILGVMRGSLRLFHCGDTLILGA